MAFLVLQYLYSPVLDLSETNRAFSKTRFVEVRVRADVVSVRGVVGAQARPVCMRAGGVCARAGRARVARVEVSVLVQSVRASGCARRGVRA